MNKLYSWDKEEITKPLRIVTSWQKNRVIRKVDFESKQI